MPGQCKKHTSNKIWENKVGSIIRLLIDTSVTGKKNQRLVFKADQSSNRRSKYCLKKQSTITVKALEQNKNLPNYYKNYSITRPKKSLGKQTS